MQIKIGDFFNSISNNIKKRKLEQKIKKGYVCTSDVDYLNCYNTRTFENIEIVDYNCGGYALKTFNWYQPTRLGLGEVWEKINEMASENYTVEEIQDWYLGLAKEQMLKDFPTLTEVSFCYQPKQNERLIAFRMGMAYDEDEEEWEYDFHYRFLDCGKKHWEEKRGSTEPRICYDDIEEPWQWWRGSYDSPILYFCLPISS